MKLVDVEDEYQKDERLKKGDTQSLLDWVNKQPHLPKIDERVAIFFLQSCYYSNEKAKTVIDNYFTVKTHCPELLRGRNPLVSPLKEALDVVLFLPLASKTPEGYSVILIKFMDTNSEKFNFGLCVKVFDMVFTQWLYQGGTSQGHLILFDMSGTVFGHVIKLNPLTMKKFLYYLQEAMPLRLKGMHYFNLVPFMDKIVAVMKPFMKRELFEMLNFHESMEGLFGHVPKDCFPEDYGGQMEATTVLHKKMKETLFSNVDFFAWEDQQTVEESHRPGQPKDIGTIFGVEGTFKRLELD